MPAAISCHYANIGQRQVHYRLAGDGPPLVLVHQSPRSSAEYLPLIAAWARDFTIIAPDTPGNGHSDPLPLVQPTIPDYADALVAFLDTLGLAKAALYGFHTGAATVACLARRTPDRVAAAVANGFAIMQTQERADFLAHYLPQVLPRWDGGHLTWMWARIREQSIFFPWYRNSQGARLDYDVYSPELAHEQVMDMLRAGDAYRAPYHAAFAFDRARCFDGPTAPLTVMAAPPDPLYVHLDRLGALPATVTVYRGRDKDDALRQAHDILRKTPLAPAALQPCATPPDKPVWRSYVTLAGGAQVHIRRGPERNGRTVLLLHDLGFSSAVLVDEITHLGQQHRVIAPDLPGHGQSRCAAAASIDNACAMLAGTLQALNLGTVDVVGFGFSAALALGLVQRHPDIVRRLILVDAHWPKEESRMAFADSYFPALTAQAHGGHLLEAWRFMRGCALFWPWHQERRAAIIATNSDALEPGLLQQHLVAHLEARPSGTALIKEALMQALGTIAANHQHKLRWLRASWTQTRNDLWQPDPTQHGAVAYYDGRSTAARQSALTDLMIR